MKKIILFIIAFLMFIPIVKAEAKEFKEINIYLFYGESCPHCKKEKAFLDDYLKDKTNIHLYTYEVWNNKKNANLMEKVSEKLEIEVSGVPYLVIGNNVVQGYTKDSTDEKIIKYIDNSLKNDYTDYAGIILGLVEETTDNKTENNTKKNDDGTWTVPILGTISAKDVSLPLLAVVIGLVDGFNPCAMWILIFLISMLIGTKDKKKMWILGFTFIFTSGFVYFLFMISWLNLAMFMNKITIIKLIISAFALAFGVVNVIRYFKLRKEPAGCDVTNPKMRKKITKKIKESVLDNKFIVSIIGIMILAGLVNIIELLCSLGLPVMFTEILSLNNLSKTTYIIYLLIYILFFLIDDLIVFIIAMKTLKVSVISNKYSKYSHLIGGIIMIIIAILMMLKPEWLMFNF